jgi:hypothetical protein
MRNYCCRHYMRCLDDAARTGRPWNDCQGCPDERSNDAAPITAMELAGIAALLARVFFGVRVDPGEIVLGELVAPSGEVRPWAETRGNALSHTIGRGEIV